MSCGLARCVDRCRMIEIIEKDGRISGEDWRFLEARRESVHLCEGVADALAASRARRTAELRGQYSASTGRWGGDS